MRLAQAPVCGGCGPQLAVGRRALGLGGRSLGGPFARSDRDVRLGGPAMPAARSIARPSSATASAAAGGAARTTATRTGLLGRPDAEPPGWAEKLAGLGACRDESFLRPRSELVCDRMTRIRYKDGEVDKSDTEHVFGRRAGKRADDFRDSHGTARLFVPEQGVSCDRERRRRFEDGDPDRRATRRYFGRRAARSEVEPPARAGDLASFAAAAVAAQLCRGSRQLMRSTAIIRWRGCASPGRAQPDRPAAHIVAGAELEGGVAEVGVNALDAEGRRRHRRPGENRGVGARDASSVTRTKIVRMDTPRLLTVRPIVARVAANCNTAVRLTGSPAASAGRS